MNGIVLNNKEGQTTDKSINTDEFQKHYVKWKNTDSVGHMMYGSIHMIFAKSKIIGPENRLSICKAPVSSLTTSHK